MKNKTGAVLLLLCVCAVSITCYYLYYYDAPSVSTDNAYVETNFLVIRSRLNAVVANVHVERHQYVNAGDLLLDMDLEQYQKKADIIKSDILLTRTDIEQEKDRLTLILAQLKRNDWLLEEIQAEIDDSNLNVKRFKQMVKKHYSATYELDRLLLDQRRLEARKQAKLIDRESIGVKKKLSERFISGLTIKLAQHQKSLELANTQIQYAKIYAPVNGYIASLPVQRGEFVKTAEVLLTLVPLNEIWLEANFKETKISAITPGQKAQITLDAYHDSLVFTGTVISVSPSAGAKLSIIPPNHAAGNFTRIVQRIPVRISFDKLTPQKRQLLRPGMSAKVSIGTGNRKGV